MEIRILLVLAEPAEGGMLETFHKLELEVEDTEAAAGLAEAAVDLTLVVNAVMIVREMAVVVAEATLLNRPR